MPASPIATAATAAAALAATTLAGPLTPPPGAPQPTNKTLQQVEPRFPISQADTPFVIARAGSYYLTENLTPLATGSDCIRVVASDVTIDLNGFLITDSEIGIWDEGIDLAGDVSNVTIRNGTISNCEDAGVGGRIVPSTSATEITLEGVAIINCGFHGAVLGRGSIVRGCTFKQNASRGLWVGEASVVRDSVFNENGFLGLEADDQSAVISCTASLNGDDGFRVTRSTVMHCAASENAADGLSATESNLANCVARANTEDGFALFTSSASRCSSAANTLNGFAAIDSFITESSADSNTQSGFDITGTTVQRSHARANMAHGIDASTGDNVIDSNSVIANTIRGVFSASVSGNIVIRNTAIGNASNYTLSVSDSFGNPSSGSLSTAGPWANIQN